MQLPYLTPSGVERLGLVGLTELAAISTVPVPAKLVLQALGQLVPLLEHVPAAVNAVQHLCDSWNHLVGAKAPG